MSKLRTNELESLETGTSVEVSEIARSLPQSVDSVADLRAASFPESLERIWLSGYYGVGTPGGGPLYIDRDDTSSEDNGGTVFVTGDGLRVKRPGSGALHLDWFGLDGGTTTDVTEAMASAFEVAGHDSGVSKIKGRKGSIYTLEDPNFLPIRVPSNIEVDWGWSEIKSHLSKVESIFDAVGDVFKDDSFIHFHSLWLYSDRGFNNVNEWDYGHVLTFKGGYFSHMRIHNIACRPGLSIKSVVHTELVRQGTEEIGVPDFSNVYDIDMSSAYNSTGCVSFFGDKGDSSNPQRTGFWKFENLRFPPPNWLKDFTIPVDGPASGGPNSEWGAIILDGDIKLGEGTTLKDCFGGLTVTEGSPDAIYYGCYIEGCGVEYSRDLSSNTDRTPAQFRGKFRGCTFFDTSFYTVANGNAIAQGEFVDCEFQNVFLKGWGAAEYDSSSLDLFQFDSNSGGNRIRNINFSSTFDPQRYKALPLASGLINQDVLSKNTVGYERTRVESRVGDFITASATGVFGIFTFSPDFMYNRTRSKITIKAVINQGSANTLRVRLSPDTFGSNINSTSFDDTGLIFIEVYLVPQENTNYNSNSAGYVIYYKKVSNGAVETSRIGAPESSDYERINITQDDVSFSLVVDSYVDGVITVEDYSVEVYD